MFLFHSVNDFITLNASEVSCDAFSYFLFYYSYEMKIALEQTEINGVKPLKKTNFKVIG